MAQSMINSFPYMDQIMINMISLNITDSEQTEPYKVQFMVRSVP